MKSNLKNTNYPTANNKNKYHMKQFYYFKHLLFSLCLLAFSLGVQAQTTYDWDNAAPDGNFKQGAAGVRWNPGGLFDEPPYGIVQFNNNNQTTMTNNVAGTWSQFKINFGASATNARTIGGNTIQFFDFGGTWPFVRNQSTANHTINFPIQIGASGTFNLELIPFSGNLTFGGTIDNQGKILHVYGNNGSLDATNRAATLSGIVSGAGKLIVSQFGVAKLNATHTYTGNTEIDNGELWIQSAGDIASGSAIFVGNGAQLANVTKLWISNTAGGTTFTRNITINNGNATTRYLGGLNSSGTHTFSGAITNNSTTGGLYLSGLTSGGTTTFSGVISGGGAVVTEGAGTVILSGASQNTWTNTLTANGTLLVLNKSADTRAIGTGNMTIATGATVRTDANNQLGTGTPSLITINGTGVFNLNNTNQKIALASASSTASVTLGSGTLNIDNTGTDTYAGTISGSGAVTKTSAGVLILTNTTNNYTGATTITAGDLRLNPSANATFSSQIVMNGGTLSTTGITATRTWTSSSTLRLTANSTIALLAATAHTLTFSNSAAISWTSPATINVTGWSGAYNGTAGTGGRLFVGSTAAGLTASQLQQILFFNGTNYFTATILGTGEVVPTANIAMFWNGTGIWSTANTWSNVSGGPYNQTWVSGRAAIFNVAASTITGFTTNVASITANENVTLTGGGTMGFGAAGGGVAPIFVANGKTFAFGTQTISSAAGTGIIKNGTGILNMGAAGGSTMPAGYTINDGIVAVGGNNGMGTGTLTINGGTIVNNSGTSRSPANTSIVVNSNFGLGDIVNFAAGTGNLIFSGTVNLGASVTRTITLGTTATYSLNGIISGASSNIILNATAAGTLSLGGVNTYGGNTTINGGTLRPTVSGALPSTTALIFANTAGAILDLSTNAIAPTVASLSGGGSTGGNIAFGASTTTTLTVGNASNTTYSGLISGASLTTGGLIKVGSGILTLGHTANTFVGTTTITAGELRLNPSTTTGTFASQVVLNGGKLSTTSIAASTVFTSTSTLNLNATSTIDLGSSAHELRFANSSAVTWNGAALVINNWMGTPSAAGTAGRIFVGSANTHLTAGQLSKITFTGYVGAMLLPTGELVPVSIPSTFTWDGSASSDWATGANWDLGTVPLSTDYVVIPTAGSYTNALIITGARTISDFTVNGTGTYSIDAAASLTVNGDYIYSSSVAATFNCTSTLNITSANSQTIPATDYGNLDLSGGARVLASSGTIGICGTFTRGAGAYTVTGSTVDYNGSGAQTIAAGTYNNLTISNARGSANLTSPAGTIAVAGTFDVSTLSAYTPVVNAASVFDFTSAGAQTIPAFYYGVLMNSGLGNRTWASSGIIDIMFNFIPGTGVHTVTGSTVRYNSTSGTINIPTFTSSATPRHFNNIIFNGAGGTFKIPTAGLGIAGTVNATAGTVLLGATAGGAGTLSVDGTFTIDGGTIEMSSATAAGTLNILGDFVQTAGSIIKTSAIASSVNFNKASGTQNITQSGGTITGGTLTFNIGAPAGTTPNTVTLLTNFTLSPSAIVVRNLATLNLSNFTLAGTNTFTANTGSFMVFGAAGVLNNTGTFTLATGANLTTAHIDGIMATGAASGCVRSSGARSYNTAANYTYNAATNGFTGTGLTGAATLTIATTAGANITLSVNTAITNRVNLQSGVLVLNTGQLNLGTVATFTGSPWGTSNMITTNSNVFWPNRNPGRVTKIYPTGSQTINFTYPLGDITGTPEYSPVTVTGSYTGATSVPYIAFKCVDSKQPHDPSLSTYLSRFWPMISGTWTGITAVNLTVECTYVPADVVGTEALLKMSRYDMNTLNWIEDATAPPAGNVLTSIPFNAISQFSDVDLCGRVGVPYYFRSNAATGAYETGSNWLISTDPTFVAPAGVVADAPPTYSNSDGIRIMNGHNITYNSAFPALPPLPADQMTIDNGGTLTLAPGSSFTITDGVGTDLTVDGTLVNSTGTITQIVPNNIQFNATGLYNHNVITSALIPTATWIAGSECRITGAVGAGTQPAGNLGQTFSDFTWNCPNQTAGLGLGLPSSFSCRNFKVVSTGAGSQNTGLIAGTSASINVTGDFDMQGGTIIGSTGAGNLTMAIGGDFLLSGGTFNFSNTGSGTNIINHSGNFNQTGGTLTRTLANATYNFIKPTGTQTFSQSAGTISGNINWNVGDGATTTNTLQHSTSVNLGTGTGTLSVLDGAAMDFQTFVLSGSGTFAAATGSSLISANTSGTGAFQTSTANGSVQTNTRTFTNAGVNYTFNGGGAQVTGNALSAAANIKDLIINNGSNVTLNSSATMSAAGTLTFTSGLLDLTTNDLTLTSGATISGVTSTKYVKTSSTGQLKQTVAASPIAFPVGNSAYNPVTLTNSGTSDVFGVNVLDAVTSPAPNDATKLINRFWVVTENVAGGSTLLVEPQYNSGEENANFAAGTTLKVGYFPTLLWQETTASSAGAGPFVITPTGTFGGEGTYGIGKDDGFVNPITTYTWVGNGAAGSWTDPNNWSPNTSVAGPLTADNIIINAPGTAGNNLNLNIAKTVTNVTFNGTGVMTFGAAGNLTINGTVTYANTFTATLDCGSTINYANPASLNIPPFNYGNLVNGAGSLRTWTAGATTGICGTLTIGAGSTFTAGAASTVDYNGTGAQTIVNLDYDNLTISQNRGGSTVTLASGIIDVAGTFNPSLSNYSPSYAGNTVNFSGAAGQGIPAFTYNNITSANLDRTWANTGTIDVNGTFAIPATGTQTITGSTVRYSSTAAGTNVLSSFTSNVGARHYNNLEIVGGASSNWELAAGFNLGATGNFSITGLGTFKISNTTSSNTMTVDGNTTINNGVLQAIGSVATAGVIGTLITNNLDVTGSGQIVMDVASNTASGTITVNGILTMNSTTANAINFGTGTNNANNIFNLKSNFSKSGTGTIGLTGTYNATSGFFFNNGSGTQTFSYSGAAMTAGNFTVSSGSNLQLLSNMTLGSNAVANSLTVIGTFDAGTFVVAPGNAANAFTLQATGTLSTANAGGVSSTISGFTNANTSWAAGATFVYTGTAANTGLSAYAAISSASQYTFTWLGTTSLTLDKSIAALVFNFTNNGLIFLGTNTITIPSSGGALTGAGFGATKMFVTDGTGTLIRSVLSSGVGLPFTWPIGETTGTTEYSPVTINSIATAGINGTIGLRVVDGVHPNITPALIYASRYWPMTLTGFNATYTLGTSTFTYVASDIVVGPETSLKGDIFSPSGSYWTELATSSAASNVLTITSGLAGTFMPVAGGPYDITPRVDVPTYYQSVGAGGNWNVVSNWEVADNISFTGAVPASMSPTNLNSSGIFIRSGSPITVSAAVSADQLTVDAGATLTVGAATFTIANGTGTDVQVNGTLLLNSASANLTVNSGAAIQVDAIFREATGIPTVANSGTITIGATGTYEHSISGGIIPTCTWTAGATCLLNWTSGSTLPTGMGQNFHHFTVNADPGITGTGGLLTTINGNLTLLSTAANAFILGAGTSYTINVAGNVDVQGTSQLDVQTGGGTSIINITGNLLQAAGTIITRSGSGTFTWNVTGDFAQSGGTFQLNVPSSTGIFNLRGNLTNNGIINAPSGTRNFNFVKTTGVQTLTQSTGTISNAFLWNVGNGTTTNTLQLLTNWNLGTSGTTKVEVFNGATLDFGDKIISAPTAGAAFVLQATGAVRLGSANGITTAPTASGNIQTPVRTVVATASYFYTGTVNQVTGNLLPTTLTGTGNLNIANTGTSGNNIVTLTANTTTPTFNLISGLFAAGAVQQLNITSGGTVNVTSGDFVTGATAGLLNFPGTGTFTGSCNPYNVDIAGGVNFGAGTVTIQNAGTLKIKAGGFTNTNAAAYAVGSTLEYATGGNYDRGIEWSTASGKGSPHHVLITSSTLNPARTGATFAATTFNVGGDLTITAGGNIYMDFGGNNMTVPLIVNGNLNLAGQLSGSGAIGGDIELKGNWNNNGVASVNFFPNLRAVTFNGTSNQNIGGTNTTVNPFDFLTINNAAGVTLTSVNVEVDNQLTMTNGHVTLGNFNLKLNGLNTPLTGGSSSNYIVTNGNGTLSRNFNNTATLYPVGPDASTYSPVTMQQSGTADDISVRVNIAPAFVPGVNDANQMVNLQWTLNEAVAGGNNLSSNFEWPLISEAAGFIRGNGVFQGDYTGAAWQARASILSGGNPYLSSSSVNYTGSLSNRPFVIGNINGIIGCVSTIAAGAWNNTATWAGGNIPPTASSACIGHAVQITGGNTNAVSAVTINAGGSLDIDATRSLVFNSLGGTLTNSTGAANTITGLGSIIFNGAGTIAGGNAFTINSAELNGLTTLSTPLTVNGDLLLNSGSSVSATPTYGSSSTLIYNTGGSYGVNVEWTGNSNTAGLGVPNNVSIRNTTTLNMPNSARGLSGTMSIEGGTLNMNAAGGADLYVNGDWTRDGVNGFFNPNGKAIFFNRSGTQNITVSGGGTETFNYLVIDKPSGSLVLDATDITNITVNASVGDALQLINSGVLDLNGNALNLVNAGGSILASGGVRSIISTLPGAQVNIQASKSVTSNLGGTLVFAPNVKVALSAGMDFGNTISTIQGTLQIALGGFVNSNPATYATGSTLRYFSGSNYGRGLEWSSTSGPGYPYHVDIDENGTVTTLDLSNGGSAVRQLAGNLNLNQGGNLSMGAMTDALIVKGNVSIGGASTGTLSLSSAAGGDIQIAGNLTRNAGGTFTQNGREVTMNGTTVQSISNNIPSFDYLNIDNTGASVQINTNTTINTRLKLTNGLYDLNGFSNTMANGSQIRRSSATATMSAAPTVGGGNSYDVRYDATMTSGVEFIQDLSKVRDLEITLGTLTIDQNKTINRDLILSGGDLDLATFTFTDRGNATAPSFAGSITVSGGGTRLIVGSLGSMFDITGLGGNSPLLYTKTVSTFGGTLLNFDSNVLVRIGDGAVDFGAGNPTTINGILQVMLAGSVGQILNPCYYGTNSILRFANTVDYQVGLNDKTWATGAIGSGNPGIPWNVEVNDVGTDLQLQNTRALRGNLTITNGTFTLTPAYTGSFAIGGNWTRTGASSAFTHNNKKVVFDKQIAGDQSITVNTGVTAETYYEIDFSPVTGNVILNGNVNALNAAGLVSGKVDLNGNIFTLGTTSIDGLLTGGSASEYFVSGSAAAKFVRYTTTANTTYNYPVGDAGNYTPMSVQLYAGPMGATSQISVNVIPSAHPNIGTSTNYLSRYWQVEPSNFPTPQTGYGVTYQWAAADEATAPIPANLKPFKHNPQGWIAALGSGANFEMGTGTVNPGTRTITWNGLYSFSDFTGNGNGTPLPISLIDFDAQPVLENVEVTWTTASETNNDYFTIERSKDGVNFKAFAVIDGAGNSNAMLNYKVMDFEPFEGLSYYRLMQTDFDGKFEYSDIKAVNFVKPSQGQNWSVYPNPSNLNGINITTAALKSDLINLSLTDVTGKLVYNKTISVDKQGDTKFIEFDQVGTGIYYLTISEGDFIKTIKVILTPKN